MIMENCVLAEEGPPPSREILKAVFFMFSGGLNTVKTGLVMQYKHRKCMYINPGGNER